MTTTEDIRFVGDGVSLAGTLHRPAGQGPHPAIVMLQGSGPADRDSDGYFPPIRDTFLGAGLAVLSWDKPGIGGSGGDWRERTLRDRAHEAVDALAWLR
ncbi:MAG TPA: CocE/NonD family hydrolase, partial [Thermomicrobiaceae bacterium]|nr:CocE/NonD family hydrolase [Thermomicrobiaceae bacterium]